MTQQKQVGNAYVIYQRLFTYIRRYWVIFLFAILASMLYSGIDAWFVYFLKPLLNKGLMQKKHEFLEKAPWMVLGVFILRGGASFVSNYNMALVARNVIMRMRQDIFTHLQRLPAKFYDTHPPGQLLSLVVYSVEQVANASADAMLTMAQSVFLVIGLLYVMLTISWKLTLFYFVTIPIIALVMRISSRRVRRFSLTIQDSMAEVTHHTEENIEGYKVVRTFGGESFETEKFHEVIKKNRDRELKVISARTLSVSFVQLIAISALSITLYVATFDSSGVILTPGGFVSMIAAMLAILKPMKDLTTVQNKIHRGLAGAQSVFELLDQKVEEDTGTKSLVRAKGAIEFVDVNFSYTGEKPVLIDINFPVKPGEIVALVGRSGSGKSTLANLLPRFYSGYSGKILLDGVDTQEYRLRDLRSQFAIVSQHVTLFNDTVANNIAYGRVNQVSEAEILAAAKAAHALEFIEQLPLGLHTMIGGNGVLLSGGQRQRLAIARAILKDAPILIFDEATSALDTESERHIQEALVELMRNRTTFVIAHRLSTIEHADKIIVMENGKVLEMGAHQELLDRAGYYARLYKMQFKDIPLEVQEKN